MKRTTTFALALCLCSAASAASVSYKLNDAIKKNLVTVQFKGAKADTSFKGEVSSHYGPCIAMEIASNSTDALNLELEYGYQLLPSDTSVQNMMVTQNLMVNLAPKQKKNYRLYAMCIEASDGSPKEDMKFVLLKRSTGNLLGIAEFLNKKKYQGNAAQDAVWCISDNRDLHSITSADTALMYDLRRCVAKLKGMPDSSIYASLSSGSSAPARTYRTYYTYSGSLSYNVSRSAKVLIALFDESNKMKTVYVNNENQRPGEYTYNYQLSSDEMQGKKHFLRMFRDGRLEEEITILPRD